MIILILIAIVCAMATFFLYRFTFCLPVKKRPDPMDMSRDENYLPFVSEIISRNEQMDTCDYEDVWISSKDGLSLHGRLYEVDKNAPLCIFFHGYHGTFYWDGYGVFETFKRMGYNILMVDERAHGQSEGTTITFGIRESRDVIGWTEFAKERYGKTLKVILAGVSMGAASVLMASKHGYPDCVRLIISDCAFTAPREVMKSFAANVGIPVGIGYTLVRLSSGVFGGFDIESNSALENMANINVPVLFIWGSEDNVVPTDMGESLYGACTSPKRKLVIEGARHSVSAMVDLKTYADTIINFVEEYI